MEPEPSPESGRRLFRLRLRTLILFVLLFAIIITGGLLRKTQIREWWLNRQPTPALAQTAAKPSADALARLVYGERLVREGRSADALPVFQQAVAQLRPDAADPITQRLLARYGHALALSGQGAAASPLLIRAQVLDSNDPRVYLGLGLVLSQQGRTDAATTHLTMANNLDPENPEGWYLLGRINNENRQPVEAVKNLKRAVALDPKFAASWEELGHAYAFQGQFPSAVDAFKKASALAPESPEYRRVYGLALAMTARSREDYDETVKLLQDAVVNEPSNTPFLFSIAQLHIRFNEMEPARKLLRQIVQVSPEQVDAWYNLSLVERRLGNEAAAAAANTTFLRLTRIHDGVITAEKKVSAAPNTPEPRLALAKEYRETGNDVGAYWQLWIAARMLPTRNDLKVQLAEATRRYEAMKGNSLALSNPKSMGPPPPPEMMPAQSRPSAPAGATGTIGATPPGDPANAAASPTDPSGAAGETGLPDR